MTMKNVMYTSTLLTSNVLLRLRKKRKVALVKNCSVISSGPEKEAPSPPQAEETPVFTIQYDLDQSHGFTLTNYFGQNMQ